MTNCPNCGAVLNGSACEYCKTDFSKINEVFNEENTATIIAAQSWFEHEWNVKMFRAMCSKCCGFTDVAIEIEELSKLRRIPFPPKCSQCGRNFESISKQVALDLGACYINRHNKLEYR